MITWQEVLLRLLVALLFCGAVGVERYLAGKAAGVRTHVLVGMGAALFTLVSGYAFAGNASPNDRIAAQVVSGIGFIGGGAILKESGSIKGLTTAAGLWAVAALGMAAGAGLYLIGGLGTAIILLALVLLRRVETHLPRRVVTTWLIHVTLTEGATVETMRHVVDALCDKVTLDSLEVGEQTAITFSAEVHRALDISTLSQSMRDAGARAITWQARESASAERGL